MTYDESKNATSTSDTRLSPAVRWLLIGVYLVMIIGLEAGLLAARRSAMNSSQQAKSSRDWLEFREAMREQAKSGPVARRPPKSDEPPGLILLRDHYAACAGAVFLFPSLLYVMVVVMARSLGQPLKLHED